MRTKVYLEDGCGECPLFNGDVCIVLRTPPDDNLCVQEHCPIAYGHTLYQFVHQGRPACGKSRNHPLLGRLVCFSPPGEEGCACAALSFPCAECGHPVTFAKGVGRMTELMDGREFEIHETFEIPTCVGCGEVYFSQYMREELEEMAKPGVQFHVAEFNVEDGIVVGMVSLPGKK